MAKPIIGQTDWGQTLNDHLDIVEGKADTAQVAAGNAQATADARETPAGAQAKADAAEANAKTASVPATQKGVASGVASLDAAAMVPVAQLPREQAGGVAGLDAGGLLFKSRIPNLSDTYATLTHRPLHVAQQYGTTDAAVRSAVADATTQGRSLLFGRGTFNITGDLAIDADRLAIEGDGDTTLLAFTGGGLILDGATTAHALRNRLGWFRVTRAGLAGPAVHLKGGGTGTGVARFGLYDIHVESSTDAAWRIDGSYIGTIVNCYGRGSTLGLDIDVDAATGVVGGNLLTFVGGEFQNNTKAARLRTTAGVTFLGCGFEGNSTEGVELIDNCRAITFINPYFEANGGYDIKVGTTTSAIVPRVLGGYFAEGGKAKTGSIFVVKSEDLAIEGAFFSGYGANSPVQINEAGAGTAKGYARNCWTNGTAPVVALNGATRWGEHRLGRENSTPVKNVFRASAVLDFPSIAAGGSANLTITVPGAAVGDDATVHYNGTPPTGLDLMAWVSGVDTVTVRATNFTSAAIDPAAATIRTIVWKF